MIKLMSNWHVRYEHGTAYLQRVVDVDQTGFSQCRVLLEASKAIFKTWHEGIQLATTVRRYKLENSSPRKGYVYGSDSDAWTSLVD
ncbi:hypothetical protein N7452_009916 [Penicillium brevicompactum]|uniref:Uncharacterized protein n=1 Tax=Penicillium brevicompactum TaxID=5074 RepID=A0A9W9UAQ8_PENBR|nr:hypothetical protein N7452_009916 [Penicillium brevicompactum]